MHTWGREGCAGCACQSWPPRKYRARAAAHAGGACASDRLYKAAWPAITEAYFRKVLDRKRSRSSRRYGVTVLMAVVNNHDWPEQVAALLDRGANVSATSYGDMTALRRRPQPHPGGARAARVRRRRDDRQPVRHDRRPVRAEAGLPRARSGDRPSRRSSSAATRRRCATRSARAVARGGGEAAAAVEEEDEAVVVPPSSPGRRWRWRKEASAGFSRRRRRRPSPRSSPTSRTRR